MPKTFCKSCETKFDKASITPGSECPVCRGKVSDANMSRKERMVARIKLWHGQHTPEKCKELGIGEYCHIYEELQRPEVSDDNLLSLARDIDHHIFDEPLTEGEKLEYVSRNWAHCPYCLSDNIEGGSVEIEADGAYQRCSCNACNNTWTDSYALSGILTQDGE